MLYSTAKTVDRNSMPITVAITEREWSDKGNLADELGIFNVFIPPQNRRRVIVERGETDSGVTSI